MKKQNSQNLNIQVGRNATILVVTDIQCDEVFEADMVMSAPEGEVFMREAKSCGFEIEDFLFINPCPPIKAQAELKDLSDAFVNAHLDSHRQEFIKEFTRLLNEEQPGIVVTLGRWSLRQVLGVSTPITKVRGTIQRMEGFNLLPLLSPRDVLRFPDRRDIYNTDFLQLEALSQHGWDVEEYRAEAKGNDYEWCLDLQELIENPPTQIAFDTETVGLEHRLPGFRVLTAAITPKKGRSLVVPLDIEWWNNEALMSDKSRSAKRLTPRLRRKLINQLKEILENPHVHVVGHNLKYDIHVMRTLDIEITNWYADTIQLAFLVDENMQSKNLDDCVRRWLPQYAGYADEFNAMTDKSRMQEVKHEPFLLYAGGDTDVCYRLAAVLIREGRKDSRQWDTFVKVQMPALRTFVEMERRGVRIDTDALTSFGVTLAESARELTSKMLEQCPPELLRAWTNAGKKVSFDSPDFLAELLFGEDYGIKVKDGKVVEKGGKPLIPLLKTSGGKVSTSAKDHLPYFEHVELVQDLIQYKKVSKMRSTYVGERGRTEVTEVERLKSGGFPKVVTDALGHFGITLPKIKAGRRRTPYPQIETKLEELGAEALVMHCAGNKGDIVIDAYGKAERHQRIEPSGFWQYIKDPDNPRIFPSFWLHRTVTGRAASSEPNGQNLPNRGELAKAYRRIFIPSEGFSFAEVDLSQAELRVAACMANEREMIRIYQEGGDIHSATAAAIMGITDAAFKVGSADESPLTDCVQAWPGSANYLKNLSAAKRATVTVSEYLEYKRQCAKAVNFGFLYGMGWRKFKVYARTDYKLNFTDEESMEMRELFFRKYPRLKRWHEAMREFLAEHGFVRALHGALRRLPNVESDDEMIVGMTSRQGINSPVQRFASDLGIIAVTRFMRDANHEDMRALLFIHDANVIEAKSERIDEAASALKYYMENTPLEDWFSLRLPIRFEADVKTGPNLCEMSKRKDITAIKPDWFRSGEYPRELTEGMEERWKALLDYGVIIEG